MRNENEWSIHMTETIQATQSWTEVLKDLKAEPYFRNAMAYVQQRIEQGYTVFPQPNDIFNAFRLTNWSDLRVVILGQDPYHGPHQAHGLCFSVNDGIDQPPSLKNIFKAMAHDLGCELPRSGCLTPWAQQGVLLLNTCLSVEAGKPQSHTGIGWEDFTDAVISRISDQKPFVVFLLWGASAKSKMPLINQRHAVLTAPHPSPLSAHRGYLTCRHFSQTNAQLQAHQLAPIDWTALS